jgi:enoyl-[acyl-carrier protein] reductase I
MTGGGVLFTMTYYGSQKVIEQYSLMGPIKAALESSVKYLANDLGPKGIRVNAISPGPVKTRAASALEEFDRLIQEVVERAPEHRLVTIDDIGAATAYLATDNARLVTGTTLYVDGGYHIVGG